MAKRFRTWNQSVFEKYLREGRGQGEGPGYMPWIRVQDFASKGLKTLNGYIQRKISRHYKLNQIRLATQKI